MTQNLVVVATVVLGILILSDYVAILCQCAPKDDLLRLTEILLSWKVIAGGLAIGGASTFAAEIKTRLTRAPLDSGGR